MTWRGLIEALFWGSVVGSNFTERETPVVHFVFDSFVAKCGAIPNGTKEATSDRRQLTCPRCREWTRAWYGS